MNYQEQLKRDKFVLIKNFMSPEMLELAKCFLDLTLAHNMRKPETNPYLSGHIEEIFHSIYADSILLAYKDKIEALFETEMIPSYIFLREYKKGSELMVHRDRTACEFSATIMLHKKGEGETPLFFCDDEERTNSIAVPMEEGDAIVFSGAEDYGGKWHYRPKLEQESIVTAFLHYVSPHNKPNNIFPRPFYRSK